MAPTETDKDFETVRQTVAILHLRLQGKETYDLTDSTVLWGRAMNALDRIQAAIRKETSGTR